jgi:hypothetical protein
MTILKSKKLDSDEIVTKLLVKKEMMPPLDDYHFTYRPKEQFHTITSLQQIQFNSQTCFNTDTLNIVCDAYLTILI